MMIAWFELVNKKNELVRQESDLMYRQRQQDLESQHEELEYELRCLMEKAGIDNVLKFQYVRTLYLCSVVKIKTNP